MRKKRAELRNNVHSSARFHIRSDSEYQLISEKGNIVRIIRTAVCDNIVNFQNGKRAEEKLLINLRTVAKKNALLCVLIKRALN